MLIKRNMFSATFPFALVIALTMAPFRLTANDKLDHLVPSDRIITRDYEKLLRRKLYLTSAELIRIVILPSTGSLGETAYSLRSSDGTSDQAIVTYTHAQHNLWAEASDSDGRLTNESRAKIARLDVPCPKPLAVAISHSIGKLIAKRREWTGSGPIIVDGTDFLFSVEKGDRQQQAVLMAGSTGMRVKTLIRLLEVLDRYCKTDSPNRNRILPQLEAEVKRLSME
jgi:hypothetical protein